MKSEAIGVAEYNQQYEHGRGRPAGSGTENGEHNFLDLRTDDYGERTELGSMRLSTRSNLYVWFGIFSIIVFAGMFAYIDYRVDTALTTWRSSQVIANLITSAETGIARIKGQEKQFLLSKDAGVAQAFEEDIEAVAKGLDDLYQMPESIAIRPAIATLRDGLVQYDEQFVDVVKGERELGIADDSGLSAALEETSKALQIVFSQAGYANLANQITRINREGRETLKSGSRQGVDDIRKRYQALNAFLATAELPPRIRRDAEALLKTHETGMLSMINQRFALDSETERFNDILDYVAPALEQLTAFSNDLTVAASKGLDKVQTFARYTLAGGSAAIVLWLIFVGMFLMRSVVSGARSLANASARLAQGDRNASVPGTGNVDAIGQIARALDKWGQDLGEIDRVRRELELSRKKLLFAEEEAERRTAAAVHEAKAAFLAEVAAEPVTAPDPEPTPEPTPEPSGQQIPENSSEPVQAEPMAPDNAYQDQVPAYTQEQRYAPAMVEPGSPNGPISSVSQQVAHFSEYVTAAAADVERTEQLVRALQEAGSQIEMLGGLVTSVRDQTNLLAFHTHSRGPGSSDAENLIPFNEDGRRMMVDQPFSDRDAMQRFDGIREATERAERTMQAVRLSMENITDMANTIASTASTQALDATNKLLSQSEYLQSMLDDIISKITSPKDRQGGRSAQTPLSPYDPRANRKP
jgi:methyl-accepting chemotaxis protein